MFTVIFTTVGFGIGSYIACISMGVSPEIGGAVCWILFVLAGIALPNIMGSSDRAIISSVKANMHAVQLGVEQYADDHQGKYPENLDVPGFSWSTYVPSNPKNP